jgi:hypothetical protein
MRHVENMVEIKNLYKIVAGKSEGKRQLGRYTHKQKNIKIDLKETVFEDVEWIHLAQNKI